MKETILVCLSKRLLPILYICILPGPTFALLGLFGFAVPNWGGQVTLAAITLIFAYFLFVISALDGIEGSGIFLGMAIASCVFGLLIFSTIFDYPGVGVVKSCVNSLLRSLAEDMERGIRY